MKLDGVSVCVLARVGMDEEEAEGRVVQNEGVTTEWREGEDWVDYRCHRRGEVEEGDSFKTLHSFPISLIGWLPLPRPCSVLVILLR